MDVEQLLSAGALHRERELAPVPPALKSTPKRFQLQAGALPACVGGRSCCVHADSFWGLTNVQGCQGYCRVV